MSKILRIGSAAAAAAGAILAAGAFALAPAAQAARVVAPARSAPEAPVVAGASNLSAARPAARPANVLPGQPMIPATAPSLSPAIAASTIRSVNWAGYAVTRGGKSFRVITATFQVPALDCVATPDAASAHWVGFDGFAYKSHSVEQDGIEADCAGSLARYRAWYEMFPRPETVSTMRVRPGDSITVSVSYSPARRRFTLTVTNNTRHRHFSVVRACAAASCPVNSAEVISEAPATSEGDLLPLADYRVVSFRRIAITDGAGHRGGLISRRWRITKILQYGAATEQLIAQPTATAGRRFANHWLGEH